MIHLLFALCTIFFEGNFNNTAANGWTSTDKGAKCEFTECVATHIDRPRNCMKLSTPKAEAELKSKFKTQATKLPLLIYFTAMGNYSTGPASSKISLFSNKALSFSLEYQFKNTVIYEFKGPNGLIATNFIDHEVYLTHSLALLLKEDQTYEIYADGLSLSQGKLSSKIDLPLTDVAVNLKNDNTTVELGNLIVSNEINNRIPILRDTLLKYRLVERSNILRKMVDVEEKRVFKGPFSDDGLSKKEFGRLYEDDECDPRKFMFPFKISEKMEIVPEKNEPKEDPEDDEDLIDDVKGSLGSEEDEDLSENEESL